MRLHHVHFLRVKVRHRIFRAIEDALLQTGVHRAERHDPRDRAQRPHSRLQHVRRLDAQLQPLEVRDVAQGLYSWLLGYRLTCTRPRVRDSASSLNFCAALPLGVSGATTWLNLITTGLAANAAAGSANSASVHSMSDPFVTTS